MTNPANTSDESGSRDEGHQSSAADAKSTSQFQQPLGTDPGFSVIRVAITVVVLSIAVGGVYFAYDLALGGPPVLYPVHGVVFLDGEPMPAGVVLTVHTGGNVGAVAAIDENGKFELMTNGEPGAFGGEHKVTIAWTDGGFPPFSYLPEKYGSEADSGFSIDVESDTGETPWKIELFGRLEAPERPSTPIQRPGGPSAALPESSDSESSTPAADSENRETPIPEVSPSETPDK
jgi:hypothetical protein